MGTGRQIHSKIGPRTTGRFELWPWGRLEGLQADWRVPLPDIEFPELIEAAVEAHSRALWSEMEWGQDPGWVERNQRAESYMLEQAPIERILAAQDSPDKELAV